MGWQRYAGCWVTKLSSGLLATWLLIFVVVASVLSLPSAEATPARFTRWPYVQNVTVSSAVICWEADAPHSGAVSYGITRSLGSKTTTRELSQSQCMLLSGLRSYTRYYFDVQVANTSLVSSGSFLTLAASPRQDINFVAWGDHRTNHTDHRHLAMQVKEANPDLVIDVGDLVDTGLLAGDWDNFFNAERELLASTSVFPVLGNHELNSPLFFSTFVLPGNERWYSFDSGPVHFTALDVVFSSAAPASEQYEWLEQDLRNTDRPWKVVWMHFPAYDYSPQHGANPALIRDLSPLFEKYGVSLVFSGHSHLYQRNVVNSVNYIITGGGGAPLHPVGKGNTTAYTESVYHFVKVSASPDKLTVAPTRLDGSQFDVFSLALPAASDVVNTAAAPGATKSTALSTAKTGVLAGLAVGEDRPLAPTENSVYAIASAGGKELRLTVPDWQNLSSKLEEWGLTQAVSTGSGPVVWAVLTLFAVATTSAWQILKQTKGG